MSANGFEVFEGPAWTSAGESSGPPYRREPYVRATLPTEVVDAKVTRWSRTHVLLHWVPEPGAAPRNVWVPAGWVTRIPREQSRWRDPYDITSDD